MPRDRFMQHLPVDDGTKLAGAVGVVRGDGEGVNLDGPCDAEDLRDLLLVLGLVGFPLVTDWVSAMLLDYMRGALTVLAVDEGELSCGGTGHGCNFK